MRVLDVFSTGNKNNFSEISSKKNERFCGNRTKPKYKFFKKSKNLLQTLEKQNGGKER